ncbi:MAG: hypothetical protein N2596_05155 [Syntrophorhabdaceae bacterium]|nr:hypothetical protein [Syntrophorhabdaceae bacterium]
MGLKQFLKFISLTTFFLFLVFFPWLYVGSECISGDCQNGKGTFLISPNSKYIGYFKNGKYHGHGTCYFPNGAKYVGQWKEGKMHGKGVYTLSTKSKYVGEFKDGFFHGNGTLYSEDGKVVFKGIWDRDRPVKPIK